MPTVILAGPIYARFLKASIAFLRKGCTAPEPKRRRDAWLWRHVWTSLVPVILMAMRAVAEIVLPKGHAFLYRCELLGDPVMATLIAVLIAMFTFGLNRESCPSIKSTTR
ncbi:hypothetical protein ACNKHS_20270 [Shigella flexneri]